jgi:putative FmdB family regulatory protein
MPIYEYKCRSCQGRFEKLRRFSEANSPAPCPQCASDDSMRLLSVFAATGGDSDISCETSRTNGTVCGRLTGG